MLKTRFSVSGVGYGALGVVRMAPLDWCGAGGRSERSSRCSKDTEMTILRVASFLEGELHRFLCVSRRIMRKSRESRLVTHGCIDNGVVSQVPTLVAVHFVHTAQDANPELSRLLLEKGLKTSTPKASD